MSELNPNAPSREGWAYYIYGTTDSTITKWPSETGLQEVRTKSSHIPRCSYRGEPSLLTTATVSFNYSSIRDFNDRDNEEFERGYSYDLEISTSGYYYPTTHYWVSNDDIIILNGGTGSVFAYFAERTAMGRLAGMNFGRNDPPSPSTKRTWAFPLVCTTAPIDDPYGNNPNDDDPCKVLINPDGSCNCCAIADELAKIFGEILTP